MGNNLDCNCQTNKTQHSIEAIQKKLQNYAISNRIMDFDRDTRQKIEKLFVFNQSHVGDKLICLIRENKQVQSKKMRDDLSSIDLEEFDQVCHANQSSIILKIQSQLKSNTIGLAKVGLAEEKQGQNCIRNLKFMLIVTAQCFGNQQKPNPLAPTDLLSKKTYLQLFLQKIKSLIKVYNAKISIFIVCPNKKLPQYLSLPHSWPQLSIQIVSFQPTYPCFSNQYKIILYGNMILFNQNQGDIFSFLLTQSDLKNYYDKYDYINFCDIYNYAGIGMANFATIGSLHLHQSKKITAQLKKPSSSQQKPNIKIINNFIKSDQSCFSNILIKQKLLQLLPSKSTSVHQILISQINPKRLQSAPSIFYFSRLPTDILYSPFTFLYQVPLYIQNKYQYSSYCKEVLGIVNENVEDIVELCPDVLATQVQIQKIGDALRKGAAQIGYPIVVVKTDANYIQ